MMEQQGDEEVPPDNSGGFEQQDVNISEEQTALKRKSPIDYGSEKKSRIEEGHEQNSTLNMVDSTNPNSEILLKPNEDQQNGNHEIIKTDQRPVSPVMGELNGKPGWKSESEMTISEKLREMDEISVQPVSKSDIKKSSMDEVADEVSVEITRKSKLDDPDGDAKHKVTNLRKNIREVMDETKLDASTLAAQREESERLARVQEQQKILRALQRQNNLDKVHDQVLSLLTEAKGSVVGNLTPSVSIAPVRVLDKKTGQILEEVPSVGEIIPDTTLKSVETEEPSETVQSEEKPIVDSKPTVSEKKEVVTIDDSSDDDCILLSDDDEEDEGDEDPHNCGLHVNDSYNVPDEQGRVLVNVGHPDNEPDIFVAPQIARVIKPHQIGGVRFLYDNIIESLDRFDTSTGFGCILAHSMGLGKTLQLVTFCDIFLRHTNSKTILCIMPINTLQNWMAEFNMWLPEDPEKSTLKDEGDVRSRNFKIHILNDSHKSLSARSKVVLNWSKVGGVLMIGYEMYRLLCLKKAVKKKGKRAMRNPILAQEETDAHNRLLEEIYHALVKPGPDLVVCDEGHRIKNSHASTSVALKQIRSKRRIVLTGYPLQNNLLEYWCMVDFVRPNYLGTKTEFCNMFEKPIQNGQCIDSTPQDIKLMRYRAHVLHSLLLGFVQRRSHIVLQTSLPKKQEYVLLVRMTDFQRSLYDVFMNEVVRIKAVPNPLKAFAVCCKIWNHPDVLYNFLKKRELDLDLELEEEAALEAVKNNNKNKTDKIDIKTEPEKVEIKSEKSNEATEETVKIKTESTPEASSTSQLTELKPIGGEKSVIPNYNNYSNQYSYQQFNNQYNPNGYYDNYNNQSYQQVNPNAGPTPDQNYYNNQYYNQSYGAPKTSYWSNESTYFNQNSYPEASKNYNYQTGTYLGQEANQFQYNNGSAPEAVKPFVEDQKPVIPQENPPPSQELEPGEIPQKALSPDSKSPAKESPEKEIHTKSNRDDGIPYEWATELMLGYVPDLLENSPKMEIFFCILEESLNMGDRTLVFSQSLLTLNLIESYLQRTKVTGKDVFWAKNTNYFRLDGSTSACDREKLINEFNANPNICLFLVSTRAGSLGINLVGANRVIVFDASWNPCHDTQAVCRVYRYGQQKPCFVYRLVMDNCLEKRIYDRQVNKQGMSDRVVDECNPDARLSIKEVTNLCWDDDKESEVKDFSEIKDKYDDLVMQQVLSRYPRSLSKEPFRHESLLVDRKEKKLSSAEKRLAQRGYELEKKASAKPSYNYTPTGKVTQYRVFRTADGTLVHRPLASVQPLQSENSNVRWIPAEVWQRQGMSTQETTLPADVVIPSNSEDKSGGFVLKAGQKVMILKSSKGIYMQLESGKIIAIKTGSKPKVNTLPNRSNPVRNGCHSDEIVNLDDDDDDEEEGEIKGESSKTKSKPDENAGSSKVPIPTESTNSQNPVENRSIHPVENKHVNLATPQQQTYSNPPIVADPGYSHSFNTQYRQQVYPSQYLAYNNNNSVPIKQENVQSNYSHSYQATPQQMSEYPQQQQNTSRVVDNSRKIEPVRETAPVNYYNQYQQQQTSYPIENQRQYAPTNVPERSNQYYAPPEKPLYQQHPSQIGQFPAPVANNMYNNANSQQNFYNSRPTTTTNQQYPNLVNQNTNSQVIPPVSTVLTGSYDKSLRRDPTPSHQTPLPGEYNPNHPPYYATPISGNSYNMNQYHQEIPPSTAPIAYQQNYYGDYNGQHNPQHQQPVRPTDNMRGGSNQAKKKPSSTKPLKSAEPVIKTEPHKSVVSAFHKPFEQTQIAVPSRKPAEKSENSRQKSSDFSVSSLTKPLPSSEYQYPAPIPPTANTYPYPASSSQYPIVPPMPTYDFPPFYYPNYTTAGTSSSTTPSLASKGYAGQHTMDSTHYPFSPNSSRSFPTN